MSGAEARISARFIEPLRRRLQEEMPGASYVRVTRLAENLEAETRSWEMGATVFTTFGVLALVLAGLGLYSVIAYDVAQRKQELAVRIALGAAGGDVLRLVVAQGLRFGGSGAVIGGAIAILAARWIEPLLFNQPARDPVVIGTVIGTLLLVAVLASVIPATWCARGPERRLEGGVGEEPSSQRRREHEVVLVGRGGVPLPTGLCYRLDPFDTFSKYRNLKRRGGPPPLLSFQGPVGLLRGGLLRDVHETPADGV